MPSCPSRIDVSDAIAPLDLEARALDAALRNAFALSERWLAAPPVEMKSLVREIVELEAGGGSQRPDIDPLTPSIETKLRRIGKGKRLVIGSHSEAEVNAGLVELIAEAFALRNQLMSGSDASIEAMSGRL